MSDAKFSFQERGRIYRPAWMSPEALQKNRLVRNAEACDMWSFAVCLWELATREVPFADLSPMECGNLILYLLYIIMPNIVIAIVIMTKIVTTISFFCRFKNCYRRITS